MTEVLPWKLSCSVQDHVILYRDVSRVYSICYNMNILERRVLLSTAWSLYLPFAVNAILAQQFPWHLLH